MTLRTLIMARSGIEDKFAQLALGLTEAGKPRILLMGSALTRHPDYKYFQLFEKKKHSTESLAKSFKRLKEAGFRR
ncbi:unnamed protein product [Phytophthora lilii]|uniref:Unnamed protein product n=1 Tax=Phytophthora lilii TaxID=2077276 RepID=A0A9W7CN47_9STRA|nr:unnamed protein product [Phytophthora lilii]